MLTTVLIAGCFYGAAAQKPLQIMDSTFNWQAKNHMLMGNLLVAEKRKVVFKKLYGFQNLEQKVFNTDSSSFALASIAKVFTATAVLQLRDKSKLKLDDPLTNYFQDFPYPVITIRHLLTHTSGLPEYELFDSVARAYPAKIFGNEDIIPALKVWPKPLYFQPGSDWRYSSMNFCLLALLVEKISGMSLAQYFATFIFIPAGMHQSYVDNLLVTRPDRWRTLNYENKPFSTNLIRVDSVPAERTMIYNYGGFTGQGGVTCTAADLLLFDRAYFNGKLLSRTSIDEALTPALLNNGRKAAAIAFPGFGYSYYGLGWFIARDKPLGLIVYHPGGRPGVGTMYVHNVTRDQTVILLENMAAGEASASSASALSMLNGKKPLTQKISLASIYAATLYNKGPEAANSLLTQLNGDQVHYNLNSEDWLDRAKELFTAGRKEMAIAMIRTGTIQFPKESIMSEAYGDVLSMTGKKDEAIAMYKKSLSQNAKNETARRKLAKLDADD